jgi:phage terminase large subunit GpA-like protein
MKPEQAQVIDLAFAHPLRDTRPIYEWARSNIAELPHAYALRGRFNVENSPWLKEPFHSLADKSVRRTTVSKAIQSGGTLLGELWLVWATVNNSGPMAYTCQSQDMVDIESKTRLFPLMEACPPVGRLLPRPGPYRTVQEVFFPHGSFLILNSATPSAQQSQSIKLRVNDEIWMPRWADVYIDACARVTAFEQQGTSHILDVSQGGFDGEKSQGCWATWSFRNGSQEEWSITCPHCRKSQRLAFSCERKDKSRAGVVWASDARREDGTWNELRIAESVRWECEHCGKDMPDDDSTRAAWKRSGHYVKTNLDAPKTWRSFHWEGLVAHPMAALAVEWAQAENLFGRMGDESARIKFKQKRQALPWVQKRNVIELYDRRITGYTTKTYQNTTVLGEVARIMVCDRQQAGWWVEIGAWTPEPTYRQLYFGKVETRDMLRELQRMYRVDDWAVGQDRGYMPSEVDRDSVAFGWSGIQGAKTKGKRWPMRDQQGQVINVPISDTYIAAVGNGHTAPYIEFDGEWAKDMLSNALAGRGFPYLLPDDFNPLWPDQVASEEKREVRPGVWHWCEVKQNNNHALDCAGMMIAAAMARGVLRFDPNG